MFCCGRSSVHVEQAEPVAAAYVPRNEWNHISSVDIGKHSENNLAEDQEEDEHAVAPSPRLSTHSEWVPMQPSDLSVVSGDSIDRAPRTPVGTLSVLARRPSIAIARRASLASKIRQAIVVSATLETPTVRLLRLRIPDATFAFHPGQWVDLFVGDAVAGFSLASPPSLMASSGFVDVAIKLGKGHVSQWAHRCQPGDESESAAVRVGGTVYLQPQELERPLLLLAGGVGITPLASILEAYLEAVGRAGAPAGTLRAVLCHSAKAPDELPLAGRMRALEAASSGACRVDLRITGQEWEGREAQFVHGGKSGRLTADDIAQVVDELGGPGPAGPTVFLCGPKYFSDGLASLLLDLGLPETRVRYEKWW